MIKANLTFFCMRKSEIENIKRDIFYKYADPFIEFSVSDESSNFF